MDENGAHAISALGRRRWVAWIVVAIGAVVVLGATSCFSFRMFSDEVGLMIEDDDVLPEGAVWRTSGHSRTLCVFGVTDVVAQNRVVEEIRESMDRRWRPYSYNYLKVAFWSGEPPPQGYRISLKPPAKPTIGEPPPPADPGVYNAPYEISLLRTVEIPSAPPGRQVGEFIDQDGVLPEGAVWRTSAHWSMVCIFGVTDLAAQDRVVEGVRESMRRRWDRSTEIRVEFWDGEPPPQGYEVLTKRPTARTGGAPPPPGAPSPSNAPYEISLLRTVVIR